MGVHKTTLETSWHQVIEETLLEITGSTYEVVYTLEKKDAAVTDNKVKNSSKEKKEEVFVTNLKKEFTFDNYVTGDTNKFAKTAAILAQINVLKTQKSIAHISGFPPIAKWLIAPVNAVNAMMKTLVPTAVFSS